MEIGAYERPEDLIKFTTSYVKYFGDGNQRSYSFGILNAWAEYSGENITCDTQLDLDRQTRFLALCDPMREAIQQPAAAMQPAPALARPVRARRTHRRRKAKYLRLANIPKVDREPCHPTMKGAGLIHHCAMQSRSLPRIFKTGNSHDVHRRWIQERHLNPHLNLVVVKVWEYEGELESDTRRFLIHKPPVALKIHGTEYRVTSLKEIEEAVEKARPIFVERHPELARIQTEMEMKGLNGHARRMQDLEFEAAKQREQVAQLREQDLQELHVAVDAAIAAERVRQQEPKTG